MLLGALATDPGSERAPVEQRAGGQGAGARPGTAGAAGLGAALSALFPGRCAAGSAGELSDCAEAAARCRFCQLEEFDTLALDCDGFDDAATNGSCR